MISRPIADLFIDISLRGGGKAELLALEEKVKAADQSLMSNGSLYRQQMKDKINQLDKLADKHAKLSVIDREGYSGQQFAAYAKRQAATDINVEMAAKEKGIALSKAELKALQGKRGIELAQKTVQEDRIKKQVAEVKNQQMMVAQYGRIGATIRQNAAMLRAGMVAAGGPAAAMAGVAAATVPAASPIHAETLAKSFELLNARIGTLFLPAVDAVSLKLQLFADIIGKANDKMPDWLKASATEASLNVATAGTYSTLLKLAGWLAGEKKEPDRPATMPARFEAFDQSWRRIQQEAASRGTAEEKIYQIQMQNLPAQTALLQQIAGQKNPPPPVGNNN